MNAASKATRVLAQLASRTRLTPPAVRTLVLAFLVATGAFWAVMLMDPPTTVAAGPADAREALSPLDIMVPNGLTGASYDAH